MAKLDRNLDASPEMQYQTAFPALILCVINDRVTRPGNLC
jgi:hypothetical protein